MRVQKLYPEESNDSSLGMTMDLGSEPNRRCRFVFSGLGSKILDPLDRDWVPVWIH